MKIDKQKCYLKPYTYSCTTFMYSPFSFSHINQSQSVHKITLCTYCTANLETHQKMVLKGVSSLLMSCPASYSHYSLCVARALLLTQQIHIS